MMFEVELTHDLTTGRVDSIKFSGADAIVDVGKGMLRIWLDDEAQMNWHRLKTAVDEEEAAEDGDMPCPSCGGPGIHQSCLAELRCDP